MKKTTIISIIFILIVLVLLAVKINDATDRGLELFTLNNMYSDIEKLDDKIAMYYLNYGYLPINKERPAEFTDKAINPNDSEEYYEIDLSVLENLDLVYGEKMLGEDDVYIINQRSHTIYYVKGVTYNEKIYYTKKLDYEKINLEEY